MNTTIGKEIPSVFIHTKISLFLNLTCVISRADMPPMSAIFAIGSDTASVPPLPDKFSLEARDFVRLCLIRDQDQRPSASELLRHPFIVKRARKKTTMS